MTPKTEDDRLRVLRGAKWDYTSTALFTATLRGGWTPRSSGYAGFRCSQRCRQVLTGVISP